MANAFATGRQFLLRLLLGFVAGFLATMTFHQVGLLVLHRLGMTHATAYSMYPVPPFGVPEVLSLAYWGGVWGIAFAWLAPALEVNAALYWIGAVVLGAIFPTLVAWFVVFPLKGIPAAGGFHFPGLLVGPIVNGLWGLGTAVFLSLWPRPAATEIPRPTG